VARARLSSLTGWRRRRLTGISAGYGVCSRHAGAISAAALVLSAVRATVYRCMVSAYLCSLRNMAASMPLRPAFYFTARSAALWHRTRWKHRIYLVHYFPHLSSAAVIAEPVERFFCCVARLSILLPSLGATYAGTRGCLRMRMACPPPSTSARRHSALRHLHAFCSYLLLSLPSCAAGRRAGRTLLSLCLAPFTALLTRGYAGVCIFCLEARQQTTPAAHSRQNGCAALCCLRLVCRLPCGACCETHWGGVGVRILSYSAGGCAAAKRTLANCSALDACAARAAAHHPCWRLLTMHGACCVRTSMATSSCICCICISLPACPLRHASSLLFACIKPAVTALGWVLVPERRGGRATRQQQ